jgi:hypothetical protein
MRERKVCVPRSKPSARRPDAPKLLASFITPALALVLLPFTAACTSTVDPGPSAAVGGAPTDAARGGSSAGIASTPGGATAASGSGGVPGGGAGPGPGAGGATAGAAQGGAADLGQPEIANKAIHRLSNAEYDTTLRDLTGTELHFGESFANEEVEGFDNIATALSMSPRQVEDYFAAALKVATDVFANPALRARIVTCTPDTGTACAETVIRDFGRRAFRRPLSVDESADLLSKYQEALSLGVDAIAALQHVVHIILASPQFLYRIEFDPDLSNTAPHPLDSYELASRLSYALWSSMPDDALFAEAAAGALATPEALRAQVDRMLADPHSEMLAKNFAARWFGSKRLDEHVSSPTVYSAYSPALAASMKQEMELYFSEFLYKDLSFAEFLTADFNFVDGPLATLYGMAPPGQAGMVRVVDTADKRKGLLGLSGFLTHTSRETRSSPIIRGKWILDAVWCTPLTVPAGLIIESLEEPAEGSAPTTVRLQMEAHRVSPACSGCHDLIDPIGLALENFDAVGRYRPIYENGLAIDTTGTMPGGQQVQDLDSLASVLAAGPQFLSCAASKFGTYALGLVFPPVNRDQIVARWTAGTPTLRNLIKETVTHDTFRSRRAESP